MRLKSLIYLILLSVRSMISAQTIPEASFNYHQFFCKSESLNTQIQIKKKLKFKDFDLIKYYASKLNEEGAVSYQDTISNCLNHWCDSISKFDATYRFQIAVVKKSDIGFLSVNKDLVYVYMGMIAQLENDKQLLSLLMLIARNHANYKTSQLSNISYFSNENKPLDELVIANKINTGEIIKLNFNLASDFKLDTQLLSNNYSIDFEFTFLYQALNGTRQYKHQDKKKNDFLVKIAKLTECMLLLNEGMYEKSIAQALYTIPNSMPAYKHLVIAKNLYMIGYYHYYNQNHYADMINPFILDEKIGDGQHYYNLATLFTWQMYKQNRKSSESEALLLNMLKLTELAQNATPLLNAEFWKLHSDTNSYHEFLIFYNEVYKYQKQYKSQKLNSVLFLNEISKASIMDAKNNVYKNSILIMPPKISYMKSIKDSSVYKDYFEIEKQKYNYHLKRIEVPLNKFIQQSNYQKAYTTNTNNLGHLDQYEYAYDDHNNSLLLKPNVNFTNDTLPRASHLKYIIYIKMHVYPKWYKQPVVRKISSLFNHKLKNANQTLLIVDVYDIEAKRYIVACRRLIETKGGDLIQSNWFDIFKTILP